MSDDEKKQVDDALSVAQKVRMERNRQRALLLRSSRLTSHPYKNDTQANSDQSKRLNMGGSRVVDSGAGFFVEENDLVNEEENELVKEPGPIIDGSEDTCTECKQKFSDSYLLKNFDARICDGCRDSEKHTLITRTESKQKYCLKDCDFDIRTPILKFIVRKNPHNERWGEMKLYFEQQICKRAMEVWGSEEGLEEQKEKLSANKEKVKKKKFEKRIKELKKAVRTSTWHKDLSKHDHEYDSENEVYDEDEDTYTKKCKTCDHMMTYEKM